jgi:hypothetical protein
MKVIPSGAAVNLKPAKTAKTFHAQESRSGFRVPVEGKIIQDFGRQSGGIQNDGINIAAPLGTPVKVVDHGVVAYVGRDIPSFGKLILVKHRKKITIIMKNFYFDKFIFFCLIVYHLLFCIYCLDFNRGNYLMPKRYTNSRKTSKTPRKPFDKDRLL